MLDNFLITADYKVIPSSRLTSGYWFLSSRLPQEAIPANHGGFGFQQA